jgi:predicted nucleic acid-binding protein
VSLVVIDPSVAAKWFLPAGGETLTDEALELLGRYAKGEVRFVVPDLFWAEFGNILWKATRLGRLTEAAADSAIGAMRDRGLPTVSSKSLSSRRRSPSPRRLTALCTTVYTLSWRLTERPNSSPPTRNWRMPWRRTCR